MPVSDQHGPLGAPVPLWLLVVVSVVSAVVGVGVGQSGWLGGPELQTATGVVSLAEEGGLSAVFESDDGELDAAFDTQRVAVTVDGEAVEPGTGAPGCLPPPGSTAQVEVGYVEVEDVVVVVSVACG